jgi:hypothetical protein
MLATIFEIFLLAAVITGIIYDEKIANFEQKLYLTWRNKK